MFEKWLEENRQEIIEKTQGVLRINSVGGPATGESEPFGPGCREALDYVLNLGREMGFAVKDLDGYAGHIEYGEGEEYIAVLAHLDVVPVGTGWTHPPFGAVLEDGKIFARGAQDDKGPGMAALYGLKAVKDAGLKLNKRVRVIFGLDEETNWRCMDHYFSKEPLPIGGFTPDADFPLIYAEKGIFCFNLVKNRKPNAGATLVVRELKGGSRVNMVPDGCRVLLTVNGDVQGVALQIEQLAKKLKVELEIETEGQDITLFVHGVSAHAMAPQTGVNAVVQAAKVLAALDTAEPELWLFLSEVDPAGERIGVRMDCEVTGPLTANLGVVKIDAEKALLEFNLRGPVDKTEQDYWNLLKAKLTPEGFEVTESDNVNLAPLYVPKDSPLVKTLLAVYEEETGEKAEPLTVGGGTYARSIPNAVAFGALFPGEEEMAHQKDEYFKVDDLLRCTKIYAKAIYELAK